MSATVRRAPIDAGVTGGSFGFPELSPATCGWVSLFKKGEPGSEPVFFGTVFMSRFVFTRLCDTGVTGELYVLSQADPIFVTGPVTRVSLAPVTSASMEPGTWVSPVASSKVFFQFREHLSFPCRTIH